MKQRSRHWLATAVTTAYAAAIVSANRLTFRYGLIPVGFGLTATAGTYCAGCALMLRNQVQDLLGRGFVAATILAGATCPPSPRRPWLSPPAPHSRPAN